MTAGVGRISPAIERLFKALAASAAVRAADNNRGIDELIQFGHKRWTNLDKDRMLNEILSRWTYSRAAASEALTTLASVDGATPRSGAADSLRQSLRRWMSGETDAAAATKSGQAANLAEVTVARAAFEACLADLQGDAVRRLLQSISRSRSLSDLWHLRAGLFTELARAHSQREAELQLARLHQHFVGLRH